MMETLRSTEALAVGFAPMQADGHPALAISASLPSIVLRISVPACLRLPYPKPGQYRLGASRLRCTRRSTSFCLSIALHAL